MNRNYNNIDDLFRDKFDDFEVDPPEYVWENVKARMEHGGGNGGGSGLTRGGIAGITLILLVIGIVTVLLMNYDPVSSMETGNIPATEKMAATALIADHSPAPEAQGQVLGADEGSRNSDGEEENKKKGKKVREDKKNRVRGTNPRKNATVIIDPVVAGPAAPERMAVSPITADPRPAVAVTTTKKIVSPLPVNTSDPDPTLPAEGSTNAAAGEDVSMLRGEGNQSGQDLKKTTKVKGNIQEKWSLGLYFTPEMITYPSDDQLRNYSYSVDLHASRKFGAYFLQSGLGISRNQDQGNSLIDYNKYLGSYEDVYDVTFDSTENGIVPVYHTETVDVYDSISHVVVSPTKRTFTYLQVPLFVGYGEQSRRFGWFVKGGPSLSFLIHEKIPQSGLAEGQARILNIEDELPGRISTHWQFIISAGVTYKLGSRISISMEPMFRYYIKSVYEQDKINTRHPFSVGLRTGLLLNF